MDHFGSHRGHAGSNARSECDRTGLRAPPSPPGRGVLRSVCPTTFPTWGTTLGTFGPGPDTKKDPAFARRVLPQTKRRPYRTATTTVSATAEATTSAEATEATTATTTTRTGLRVAPPLRPWQAIRSVCRTTRKVPPPMTDQPPALRESTGIPALAATEQHMQLLRDKRDRLNAALIDSQYQYLTALAREHRAGRITWVDLNHAHEVCRSHRTIDLTERWNSCLGVTPGKVRVNAQMMPNGANGTWHGVWPLPDGVSHPPRGAFVAYILFDDVRAPCYVGSTKNFRERLKNHYRDGKRWTSWIAHSCTDRKHAYQVETKFLQQYKPPMNRTSSAGGAA